MFSVTFRTYQLSHFRTCLNKLNIQHTLAAAVHHRHVSTESNIKNSNFQSNDSELQNIYKGLLTPRIRNLKIVSFMTSGVGVFVQPMILQKAAELGSSLAATIGLCTITGFFTFISPVLIHLVTRKYVTSLEYDSKKDEYMATTISFFLKPKMVQFKVEDVKVPMTQKLTVTFYAKECPFFVDPHSFEDVTHYQRILGYDKPFGLDQNIDVCKKPLVKPANKS